MHREGLGRLLRPRSIAFVGGRHLAAAIRTCNRAGFGGEMWVVNPHRDEIGGIACVARIEDLPAAPDAALVALSPANSVEAVAALAARGAGGAVVMSSGFRETGDEGAALEAALVAAAGEMALIGPNCLGVLNLADGAAVVGDDLMAEPVAGPCAAIISQSGAFLISIACVERAFPLGYAISLGNQAQVSHADCIEAVLDDPRVKAIGLYIEGVEDGAALGRACWRAAGQGVPVVALKGGDGERGAEVARSHTAALTVERTVWEAFAERYGILEVSSLKALVETLKLLTIAGVPRGPRLTVVSFSGGLNGQVARFSEMHGLDLAAPDAARARGLRSWLPDTISVANPLDLNLPYTSNAGPSLADEAAIVDIIADMAEGVADQVVFFVDVPPSGPDRLDEPWLPAVRAMRRVRDRLGLPCVVSSILPGGLELPLREKLLEEGIAPLCGFAEAMEALGRAAGFARRPTVNGACPPLVADSEAGAVTGLDEAAAKELLARHGIASPSRCVAQADEASAAAERLGGQVALKVLDGGILHKAAHGGVALNLAPDGVGAAIEDMRARLGRHGHRLDRVLIEAMIPDQEREVILGVRRVGAMGLAMIVGEGGAQVEARGRVETLLLPLQEGELQAALTRLGLGNHPPLSEAARAFAAFATAQADRLDSAEVNPLILTTDGRALAADAVIQLYACKGETQ